MIITLLFLSIFLVLLCHYLIHHKRFWKLIDQIPGPPPLLLVGNTFSWIGSLENLLHYMENSIKTYYPILKVWSYHAIVVISHPDDVETILSNSKEHIRKGFVYKFMYPWLGTGLLTSEGTKWHTRRRLLTPAFHFNILKQYTNILIEEGNVMAQCLKDNEKLIVNDLCSLISHHTLNAICETAMGTALKDMGEFQQQYLKTVHEMNQIIVARLLQKGKNIIKKTGGQYLKQFENNSPTDDEEILGMKRKQLAMLDLLIAVSHNNNMSDLDIREEVDTFMFEGHDTVSTSICFTILLLAEHKNIQDRVRSEVNAVMVENNGKLTMTALNNMPYLERCLKESLRLYPSVPYIFRTVSKDVKLQSYIVPAETIILIPIKMIHRNPEFWPNPDVFDPDRFLPENFQDRHFFSYLPFSAGSRNCIGQRFAMLELKAMIAPLVHNFYLEPVDYLKDFRFRLDLISRVVNPIRVKFIPIEKNTTI